MQSISSPLVVVEFDLRLPATGEIEILRICNPNPGNPLVAVTDSGTRVQPIPCLDLPITIGVSIPIERTGEPMRGGQSFGSIAFLLHNDILPWLDYIWEGNSFRVYLGEENDLYANLIQVYIGKSVKLIRDLNTGRIQVSTTGVAIDFDKPLTERLYGEIIDNNVRGFLGVTEFASGNVVTFSGGDLIAYGIRAGDTHIWTSGLVAENLNTPLFAEAVTATTITYTQGVGGSSGTWSFSRLVPTAIANRPWPLLYGQGKSLACDLLDEATATYGLTFRGISAVDEVRVGGIPWNYASPPGAGEWDFNATRGEIIMGSPLIGGELRVDAKGFGWETATTAGVMEDIITGAAGTVNLGSFEALEAAAPELIGHFRHDNLASVLDEITTGIGGWWAENDSGEIIAGLIEAPAVTSDAEFTEINIESFSLVSILPPVWRMRGEYARNWMPGTQFYEVTDEEKQAQSLGGILTLAWQDFAVLNKYPRALDLPPIRTLVLAEADCFSILNRLFAAWRYERRIYELVIWGDLPELWDTVHVDYDGVIGNFRVISKLFQIGNRTHTIRIWG